MPTPAESTVIIRPHHVIWSESLDGNPPYDSGVSTSDVVTFFKVRPASVSHPRRADRTRALGPWSTTTFALSQTPGIGAIYSDDGRLKIALEGQLVHGNVMETWYGDISTAQRLREDCRRKALAQVSERTMQLSAALRQARDTFGLVGKFATTLHSGLQGLMEGPKGLLKEVGKMTSWKKIPDRYLEYLYGIAPLGDDVANAFNELSGLNELGFQFQFTLKARKQVREASTARLFALRTGSPFEISGESVSWARVGYTFSIPEWYFDRMSPIAPFSTEWEMLPGSFVLDWFLPIGDMIGAAESMQYSPFFKEGFETYGRKDSFTGGLMPASPYPGPGSFLKPGSVNLDRFFMQRDVTESLASIAFSLPDLRNSLNLNKASQGLSLISQAAKRWR